MLGYAGCPNNLDLLPTVNNRLDPVGEVTFFITLGLTPADEPVGQERMNFEDGINLGRSHIDPAEAKRRHTLLHRREYEARFLVHCLG
jgi:hypothetical protein